MSHLSNGSQFEKGKSDLGALLKGELLEWLLEGEPWVVYRTLVDLLCRDERDEEVVKARVAISNHPLVKKIFSGLNEDGYWGEPKDIYTWWPKKNTTFWVLPMLADFGFTVEDKRIAVACEYVFSTQLQSGGFGWSPPTKPGDCHSAIIIESLARLGLLRDPRLQRGYEWLVKRNVGMADFGARTLAKLVDRERRSRAVLWLRCLCLGHWLSIQNFETVKLQERAVIFSLDAGRIKGR